MVRTADNVLRVAGGKSSRKGGTANVGQESRSRSPSSGSGDRGGGFNAICPRETPGWQKPITDFFTVADKSSNQKTEVIDKPGTSKNSDVNMIEIDNEFSHGDKQSVEVMDQEFHDITIDKSENNKENETNSANSMEVLIDPDIKDGSSNRKKKVNARDDDADEEMAPVKRIKLDKNMFEHLQELEQA